MALIQGESLPLLAHAGKSARPQSRVEGRAFSLPRRGIALQTRPTPVAPQEFRKKNLQFRKGYGRSRNSTSPLRLKIPIHEHLSAPAFHCPSSRCPRNSRRPCIDRLRLQRAAEQPSGRPGRCLCRRRVTESQEAHDGFAGRARSQWPNQFAERSRVSQTHGDATGTLGHACTAKRVDSGETPVPTQQELRFPDET
jgi:hypothetical protein